MKITVPAIRIETIREFTKATSYGIFSGVNAKVEKATMVWMNETVSREFTDSSEKYMCETLKHEILEIIENRILLEILDNTGVKAVKETAHNFCDGIEELADKMHAKNAKVIDDTLCLYEHESLSGYLPVERFVNAEGNITEVGINIDNEVVSFTHGYSNFRRDEIHKRKVVSREHFEGLIPSGYKKAFSLIGIDK